MVKLYKVGGFVRDQIIGVKSKDIDYAVEANSFEEMHDYISSKGKIFLSKPEFMTIRAKIDKEDADFVLCRKDSSYSDGRHPDSVTIGDIYDDLARRDFTMNAIALDQEGNIIDPFNGQKDIQERVIRCVGVPNDRLNEDGLRIFRAFRFAITKNFKMDETLIGVIHNFDVTRLDNVSSERIRSEMNRCFSADTKTTLYVIYEFKKIFNYVLSRNDMRLKLTNEMF